MHQGRWQSVKAEVWARNWRQPEWDRVLLAGVLISRHVWTIW
jgi:hypothetical protein